MSWLPAAEPDRQGWDRVLTGPPQGLDRAYAPDAAATVLDPRVTCNRTRERLPLSDACRTACFTTCGNSRDLQPVPWGRTRLDEFGQIIDDPEEGSR